MKLYKFTVFVRTEILSVSAHVATELVQSLVVGAAHYSNEGGDISFFIADNCATKDKVASFAKGEWSRVLREDYSG